MKKLTLILAITILSYVPLAQPSARFICTLWLNVAEKRKIELEKERQQEQENSASDSILEKEIVASLYDVTLQESNSTGHTTA